jgi:type IV secretory pathway VirD2 relaxase
MADRDDKPGIQLGKKKGRGAKAKDEIRLVSNALRSFHHVAKDTVRAAKRGFAAGKRAARATARARAERHQRCSVRMVYRRNKSPGQWRAYGAYMAKDTGAREEDRGKHNGYDASGSEIDAAQRLAAWQVAGDEHIFRFIVSPEFGDRADLTEATRVFVAAMEKDLGTKLEWVAVNHYDTDNPHTHIAVRSRRDGGQVLRVPSEYIKSGHMRERAENAIELQLGYRTSVDVADAAAREVGQQRYTGLDRLLKQIAKPTETGELVVDVRDAARYTGLQALEAAELARRLTRLETMGLASRLDADRWQLHRDFEGALRAMQRTNDRLKQKFAHAAIISDPRLPFKVTELKDVRRLVGRVISHGEEESSQRMFSLIEGREGAVHYVLHNKAMREAWASGQMKTGTVVDFRKDFESSGQGTKRVKWSVKNWGSADKVLQHRTYLREAAAEKRASADAVHWHGWLGRHDAAVASHAVELKRSDRSR